MRMFSLIHCLLKWRPHIPSVCSSHWETNSQTCFSTSSSGWAWEVILLKTSRSSSFRTCKMSMCWHTDSGSRGAQKLRPRLHFSYCPTGTKASSVFPQISCLAAFNIVVHCSTAPKPENHVDTGISAASIKKVDFALFCIHSAPSEAHWKAFTNGSGKLDIITA